MTLGLPVLAVTFVQDCWRFTYPLVSDESHQNDLNMKNIRVVDCMARREGYRSSNKIVVIVVVKDVKRDIRGVTE